jgi:peroxiredoxin
MNDLSAFDMKTNIGVTVYDLSKEKPVLLVFLRHFGCIFCREAMKDIASKREMIKSKGIRIVLVHMSEDEVAEEYFKNYKLSGIPHVSDPECKHYASFGLVKGSFSQLFGLKNFLRGIEVTAKGTPLSLKQIGDGFQMPGIFMIRNGQVVDSYIHKTAADRPDYDSIISCCAA